MTARLTWNAYGKDAVRLVKVERRDARHELHELTVEFRVEGDFHEAYVHGENRRLLPTDSMKNAVYALAREHAVTPPESFGVTVARQLLAASPAARRAAVQVTAHDWRRGQAGGEALDTAFIAGTAERRLASVRLENGTAEVEAGLTGLRLLRTAGSAFTGFLHDRYTTLPETEDRVLATSVEARWRYAGRPADYDAAWGAVRAALVECFCTHQSASVQHTLYAMGESALARRPDLAEIRLVLPNHHHVLPDLGAFGLDNPGVVFVPLAEPAGRIEAVVSRAS